MVEDILDSSKYIGESKGYDFEVLDIYDILMIFYYDGDYAYPEPGITYTPCNDGLRPVIFKIEKYTEV